MNTSDREVNLARREYEADVLCAETAENLAALVMSAHITRRELASRLGVTPGRVSQFLSGAANLTLRTVAETAWALGYRARVHLAPILEREQTPAVGDPSPPAWLARVNQLHRDLLDEVRPAATISAGKYPQPSVSLKLIVGVQSEVPTQQIPA